VLVLAGDLPFARTALPRLLAALDRPGTQAAVGLDPLGHRQPLLAGYPATLLASRLTGPVADLPMRTLLAGLAVVEVPVSAREAFDLDTPATLAVAEAMITE
jgi:CTP:molybdopterin cytidylyltransferase MocA